MTQDEELEYIVALLDEHDVPKTDGLAIFSTYGRVAWLARKAAQLRVQLTGGTLPDLQALSQPKDLSGLEVESTPPTSN